MNPKSDDSSKRREKIEFDEKCQNIFFFFFYVLQQSDFFFLFLANKYLRRKPKRAIDKENKSDIK